VEVYILPYWANEFCGFENRVDAVIEETGVILKDRDFEDTDSPNVSEYLDSHSQPLTDTNLTEMEQQRTYET
jgi:hypothetical protein